MYSVKHTLPTFAEERPVAAEQIDPDPSLVARAQAGDLDAFEELVTRHSRGVHRTLVDVVGNVQELRMRSRAGFRLKYKDHELLREGSVGLVLSALYYFS